MNCLFLQLSIIDHGRRYKAGYVWQDLLDDDLITPISDNEYVLKGSQINPTPLGMYVCASEL